MDSRVATEDEDYHYYGTPIGQEEETHRNQYRKEVKDPAATQALPVWKQEVTDEQGRRRFHGAFTGGFSAGYYNTVGSKEGWAPSTFVSSRSQRAEASKQSVEAFLDEDELEEYRKTHIQTTAAYDTFGSTAAEAAKRAALEESRTRQGHAPIPGLVPEEMIVPVAESIGYTLLQRMGWRPGKGVGHMELKSTGVDDDEADDGTTTTGHEGGEGGDQTVEAVGKKRRRREWSQHTTVGTHNTPLYLLEPKLDQHGLNYDPFKGAHEFREAKLRRSRDAGGGNTSKAAAAAAGGRQRKGVAFGSGVLDGDDSYGILDDYVTHDDVETYMDEDRGVDDEGRPIGRGPKVEKRGLGDRLALKGYSYEIMDEEESDGDERRSSKKRKEQLLLPGRDGPTLYLQSKKGGLLPGFIKAHHSQQIKYFPPPILPKDYIPRCPLQPRQQPPPNQQQQPPSSSSQTTINDALLGPEPPKPDPPSDNDLKQEIDRLAFYVARNGMIVENVARERQKAEGSKKRSFLLPGGDGADYYIWKLYTFKKMIGVGSGGGGKGKKVVVSRDIGQRSKPLGVEERGALLGEVPLPAIAAPTTTDKGITTTTAATTGGGEKQPLARSLMNIAEGDRQRLQALLGSNFVRGESQDMLQPDATALRPGLTTLGGTKQSDGGGRSIDGNNTGNRASYGPSAPAKVITAQDLSRPLQVAAQSGLPLRRIEEWRPTSLLCKRLNVPDPYKNKPQELNVSKFRTDYLALPDTAAAVAKAAARMAPGAEQFLLPPSVQVAMEAAKEAEEVLARRVQQQQEQGGNVQGEEGQQEEDDAAGMADAFLSSLAFDVGFGGSGGGEGGAAGEEEEAAPPLEKPVDLFRAIFEDTSSDEDEDEDEQTAEEEPQQQPATAVEPTDEGQQQQQPQRHVFTKPTTTTTDTNQPAQVGFGFAKLRSTGPSHVKPITEEQEEEDDKQGNDKAGGDGGNKNQQQQKQQIVDEAMQKRVKEALDLLKGRGKHSSSLKKDKEKDKKHHKKRSKEKHAKEHRHKHHSKHKKEKKKKKKHTDDSDSDNDSNYSS